MVWQGVTATNGPPPFRMRWRPGDVQPANAPPAFSLGDRAVTTSLLSAAGFASINFAQVHEPVFHGPSIDAAHDAIVDLFLV